MKKSGALAVLYIFNGLFVLATAMLVPIYAIFAQEIGANVFTVSALAATLLVARVFFTLIVRSLGDDAVEEVHLLLAGFALRAAGWFILIFIGSIEGLFLVQIVFGLGESLGSPAFNALFAQHLKSGRYVSEYADWEVISAIGGGAGAFFGGYIAYAYGFDALFFVMGVLALLSFAGVHRKRRSLL